jgi:hypothetical protein
MSLGVCRLAIILHHSRTVEWAGVIRVQQALLLLLPGVVLVVASGSSQTTLIRVMQAPAEASVLCSRHERQ